MGGGGWWGWFDFMVLNIIGDLYLFYLKLHKYDGRNQAGRSEGKKSV